LNCINNNFFLKFVTQMDVRVTVWLSDPPVVRVDIRNSNPTRHANIKFVFIMHEGNCTTSFERNWTFRFPLVIRNRLQLALIGIPFSWALFEGRVTRLGEFSPNGRLFTIGRFSKMTEVAPDFGLHLRL
jgi:hypothetical protein